MIRLGGTGKNDKPKIRFAGRIAYQDRFGEYAMPLLIVVIAEKKRKETLN